MAEVKNKVKLICEILDRKYIRLEQELSRKSAVEEAAEIGRDLRKEVYGG